MDVAEIFRNSMNIYVAANESYESIPQIIKCTKAQSNNCLALARFIYVIVRAHYFGIAPRISFAYSFVYVGTHIFLLNLCYVGIISFDSIFFGSHTAVCT